MNITVPGLSDALGKLDTTSEQMTELVAGINEVVSLLKRQNELLEGIYSRDR